MASNRHLLLLLLLAGCRTIGSVRAPLISPPGFPEEKELRSLAALAETSPDMAARRDAAKRAVVLARHWRELEPNRVEGHYWYAIAAGLLADADRSYGLDAVGEMETALKHAMEMDERYDFAGPLRVLGILYLRAPGPPTSIGSPRKALRLLQRSVELFPDYEENYLYLAEALRDTGKPGEARAALEKPLAVPRWKADAEKLLRSLPDR